MACINSDDLPAERTSRRVVVVDEVVVIGSDVVVGSVVDDCCTAVPVDWLHPETASPTTASNREGIAVDSTGSFVANDCGPRRHDQISLLERHP